MSTRLKTLIYLIYLILINFCYIFSTHATTTGICTGRWSSYTNRVCDINGRTGYWQHCKSNVHRGHNKPYSNCECECIADYSDTGTLPSLGTYHVYLNTDLSIGYY